MSWDMLLEPIVLLTIALGVMMYTSYTMFTIVDYYKIHRSKPLLLSLFGAAFVYSLGQWTTCIAIEMMVSPYMDMYTKKETTLVLCFTAASAAIGLLVRRKVYRLKYVISAGLYMFGIVMPLVHILYFGSSISKTSLYINFIFIILISFAGVFGSFYWYRQKFIPFYRLKAGLILAATITTSSYLVILTLKQGNKQLISNDTNYMNNTIQLLVLVLLFFVVIMTSMALQWWLSRRTILDSHNKYKLLVEQFSDTTALIKGDRWEYINPSGLKLFQAYHEKDLLGKSIYRLIDSRDYDRLTQWLSFECAQHAKPIELRWKTFEGELRHTEVTLLFCTRLGEEYRQVLIKDIMKQKKEEEKKLIAAKLSAAKHLAAGIAHEIRNPLTSIKGFLNLIISGRFDKKIYYSIMKQEILDIETLINNMLMLVKPRVTDYTILNITDLMNEVISVVEQQLNSTSVQMHCTMEQPLFVRGVEQQLRIVFHNLLKNAAEAMPNGGTVSIQIYSNNKEEVVIVIRDEGEGVTEEQLARIGQPYFSTKDHGTGIELMVSYTIIDNHDGRINADSQVGSGTTYTIWFPQKKRESGSIGKLNKHAETIADKA